MIVSQNYQFDCVLVFFCFVSFCFSFDYRFFVTFVMLPISSLTDADGWMTRGASGLQKD